MLKEILVLDVLYVRMPITVVVNLTLVVRLDLLVRDVHNIVLIIKLVINKTLRKEEFFFIILKKNIIINLR